MTVFWCLFVIITILATLLDVDGTSSNNHNSLLSLNIGNCSYLFLALVLAIFCGCRGVGIDEDSKAYVLMMGHINVFSDVFCAFEPTFSFLVLLLKTCHIFHPRLIFIVYALLSVALNFYVIKKYTLYPFWAVLLYYSYPFLVHDMTEIRIAVAIPILIYSVQYIYNKDVVKFLSWVFMASLFHYASLLFLVFYLISPSRINLYRYALLLLVVVLLCAMGVNGYLYDLKNLFIGTKYYYHFDEMTTGGDFYVFKLYWPIYFVLSTITCLNLWFYKQALEKNKYSLLFSKISYYGLLCVLVFSFVPVLAIRISELFIAVGLFSVLNLAPFVPPKIRIFLCISVSMVFMTYFLYHFWNGTWFHDYCLNCSNYN